MDNKTFLLKPNKGTDYPERIIFFDTETKDNIKDDRTKVLNLKLGVACYWHWDKTITKGEEIYYNFEDINSFWDWVEKHTYNNHITYIIAHNLSFDMKVMSGFKELADRGWDIKSPIFTQNCQIWEFTKGKKKLKFLDNMNYFNTSLDSLGQAVGLHKMQMPRLKDSKEKWFKYCKRDVEVMVKAWKEWLKLCLEKDFGHFSPTVSSQSFNAFRHRFMDEKIYIHHKEKPTELERESYKGGRTEAFRIGKVDCDKIYDLDVNSMYPSVMRKYEYPTELKLYTKDVSVKDLRNLLKQYAVIAKVIIEPDEPAFGVKKNKRLCFTVERQENTLTSRELEYALERDWIKKVKVASIYYKSNMFKEFVETLYGLRLKYKKEDKPAFAMMVKLLLNSLYGKWGQRNDVWEKLEEDKSVPNFYDKYKDLDSGEYITDRCVAGLVERKVGKEEGYYAFPAISAHIVADARMHLWELMKEAGRENVFYCDTDSVFVNKTGKENLEHLMHETKLGYLKVEDKSDSLIINGLKDYVFGENVRLKGVPDSAKKVGKNKYEYEEFEGIKGSIRSGSLDEQIVRKVTKTLKREYKKGVVLKSGRVEPFGKSKINIDNIQF